MIPTRKLLRALLLACGWLLLFVALCGPHSSWSVCLTGMCHRHDHGAAAAAPDPCCCCKSAGQTRVAMHDGEFGNDAACPRGCCVDFMIAFENGPLPTPIVAPSAAPALVAVLPLPTDLPVAGAHAERFAYHDTGPPRPDAKTALRRTTVLRE